MANLGYLGHMWELFPMWTWISLFVLASFQGTARTDFWGLSAETAASLVAFLVVAASGPSSLLAGWLADTVGRSLITIASLVVSGTCSLLIGLTFGGDPLLVSMVAVTWGFAIAPDSAQYSAAISELAEPQYIGTALTMQTSIGFLLTLMGVRIVPSLVETYGWQWSFPVLSIGPLLGIVAMWQLRRSPAAIRLAGGRG